MTKFEKKRNFFRIEFCCMALGLALLKEATQLNVSELRESGLIIAGTVVVERTLRELLTFRRQ